MSNYDNRDSNFSKNLFKQKYFCQMCNRQCRDRDGFNCHLKTETHKRNVEIVSRNPEEFINKYSYEFESGFLDILKRTHQDVFVSANKVYQEYISDKFSTHLNATRWSSLTGFLKHLQAQGKCEIMVTDKEINIKYVDLSPESLKEKKDKERKVKNELREEKRKIEELKKIMEKAESEKTIVKKIDEGNILSSYVDTESLKNISFTLENKTKSLVKHHNIFSNNCRSHCHDDREVVNENPNDKEKMNDLNSNFIGIKRKTDTKILYKDIKEEQSKQNTQSTNKSHDYNYFLEEEIDLVNSQWLSKGLVVRIKDKELNKGTFLNKKATVLNIDPDNEFIAEVEVNTEDSKSTKTKLKIDQVFLEPVIPKEDSTVIILCGKHKNQVGQLKHIKLSQKTCTIRTNSSEIQIELKNICKYTQ
jgi:DNA/RNA-binding protein KIN17